MIEREKLNPIEAHHYSGEFENKIIDLTGHSWLNCVFRSCTLNLDRYDYILGCLIIEECTLTGHGWFEFSEGRLKKQEDGTYK
jgi:hypothetical protein